jgi:hypothetical protein|tara:strand:+ start:685 stop:1920 length:1236 start_codon:yes stop_codon:yes gene_type:complete
MNKTQKGEVMKTKLFKTSSFLLAGLIIFSACEDEADVINLGDAVGTWELSGLTGRYERKIVTGTDIEYSADKHDLVATWKDAAGFAAVTGTDAAFVTAATNQTLASFKAGDNAPGFPRDAAFDAALLTATGIKMTVDLLDSKSADTKGTYTVTGTYPSLRLNEDKCETYLMIPPPQINDSGDWTVNYDTGVFELSPVVDIDQVLPPFKDGKFTVNRDATPATFSLNFLDRDAHDSKYSEVKTAWNEADDRVLTGIHALPLNAAGGFDPTASTDPSPEGYIMNAALAPWGLFLTYYALNVLGETAAKVADVKNPLTDLNGDGAITPLDMVGYMHADNLAEGGGKTAFGMPYAILVDSTNPAAPAVRDDSATDFALTGLATGAGGKLKWALTGVCMPVNETIQFNSSWTEKTQ